MIADTSTLNTGITTYSAFVIPSDTMSGPELTSKSILASILVSELESVFATSSSTPLSPTSLSTASAIIIGATLTTACIVAIFIFLIIVAYICVTKKSSSVNRPSDDSNTQQGTTGSITTDDRSLQDNPAYESGVITADNPAYESNIISTDVNRPSDDSNTQQGTTGSITTDDRSLQDNPAYESGVITADNPAYESNIISTDNNPAYESNIISTDNNPAYNVTNNSPEVEDNAEYMYID
ncbi:PREDICTED: uncharacterized protein LOC109584349 [Amphimedon queenslandica]|uniref:Uncharacterized protein n=1 Tax=Amphimedon queenslandica TaxID=400682 RepID=A0AAN0JF80_AMPQE|nr:PREDICTED: uncharacterized protein LOC109584349 [Amphimedon queenslandica]|eukprot:XP_019855619.1 PREDICTED: uncharacterized protein LOC109584349 [Amphimedon queenslandica]